MFERLRNFWQPSETRILILECWPLREHSKAFWKLSDAFGHRGQGHVKPSLSMERKERALIRGSEIASCSLLKAEVLHFFSFSFLLYPRKRNPKPFKMEPKRSPNKLKSPKTFPKWSSNLPKNAPWALRNPSCSEGSQKTSPESPQDLPKSPNRYSKGFQWEPTWSQMARK